MRAIYILILVSMTLFLVGCNTAPVAINTATTVAILPEDHLLEDCAIDAPPAKTKYLAATQKEREKFLADYAMKQTSNLIACNVQKAELRKWKQKQKALHASTPKGEN